MKKEDRYKIILIALSDKIESLIGACNIEDDEELRKQERNYYKKEFNDTLKTLRHYEKLSGKKMVIQQYTKYWR